MNERDMEYLGSINTGPGPNAGRSIDPTKPGPDAKPEYYSYADMDGITTRNVIPAQSNAAERRDEELREDERLGSALRRAQDAEDRLAALAQSDAGPDSKLEELVSRWEAMKDGGGPEVPLGVLQNEFLTILSLSRKGLTAPPRPDASAGLIEAAEFLESLADEMNQAHPNDNGEPLIVRAHRANGYRQSAEQLRARAADRSGK